MKIGLVGLPRAGKTTVFNALTGLAAETGSAGRGKTHLGAVKVPDPRVDALAEIFHPNKTVYAEIVFSDVAAEAGAASPRGIDRTVLAAIREVDALCQVVRAFEDPTAAAAPDPMRELGDLEAEMILADLELIEKRIERLKKEKGKPREDVLLQAMKQQLDAMQPLRSLALAGEDWAMFSGFRFPTRTRRTTLTPTRNVCDRSARKIGILSRGESCNTGGGTRLTRRRLPKFASKLPGSLMSYITGLGFPVLGWKIPQGRVTMEPRRCCRIRKKGLPRRLPSRQQD